MIDPFWQLGEEAKKFLLDVDSKIVGWRFISKSETNSRSSHGSNLLGNY